VSKTTWLVPDNEYQSSPAQYKYVGDISQLLYSWVSSSGVLKDKLSTQTAVKADLDAVQHHVSNSFTINNLTLQSVKQHLANAAKSTSALSKLIISLTAANLKDDANFFQSIKDSAAELSARSVDGASNTTALTDMKKKKPS
jgi:hypothetical protein